MCEEFLSFGQAMHGVVQEGRIARREEWRRADSIYASDLDPFGTTVCVRMKTEQRGPYHPTNCDMVANDWYFVL